MSKLVKPVASFGRLTLPVWGSVGGVQYETRNQHYVEYPDLYFKVKARPGLSVAQIKGKHVLAVFDLCRALYRAPKGDAESCPSVPLSAAWDVEQVFERL